MPCVTKGMEDQDFLFLIREGRDFLPLFVRGEDKNRIGKAVFSCHRKTFLVFFQIFPFLGERKIFLWRQKHNSRSLLFENRKVFLIKAVLKEKDAFWLVLPPSRIGFRRKMRGQDRNRASDFQKG